MTNPPAPRIFAALEGGEVRLDWEMPPHMLPIAAYGIERRFIINPGEDQVEIVENYGELDGTRLAVPPLVSGTHSFLIRCKDSSGNLSPWNGTDFTVLPPGRVTVSGTVVDNNILFYWTAPDFVFFPIREYLFRKFDEDAFPMEIGRVDALFFSTFETAPGRYTYGITPVDMAGNEGSETCYTTTVAQPPDFVFYYDVDSVFNGAKTNFLLDGRGGMVGPAPESETWGQNITRSGKSAWQEKIDAAMLTWLDPPAASGLYRETVDTGLDVPNTKITVTATWSVLSGLPSLGCKIETSPDNAAWTPLTENGWEVFAQRFRYVRYTITVSGGLVNIANINCRLDVKKRTDFGRVYCAADDNGSGFAGPAETPMLAGTWIPFTVGFTDVTSLPKPNVLNNKDYAAYIVFVDTPFPEGFRCFVLDKDGNRASADVDWAAYGV